jgi:hypothetical protein
VRRMRPTQPWGDVVRILNRTGEAKWTSERLRRTVRRLVVEQIVEPDLVERAPRRRADDRLVVLVAGIAAPLTARCSRSPPSLKPCASARPAAARVGIPRRCGTCCCRHNGAG